MTERSNLDAFIGRWNTSGRIVGTGTSTPIEINGYDTYEWLAGGFFIVHKVDVFVGTDRKESLEIIGYDEKTNTFPMHFFDNQGSSGLMQASFNNGVWTFLSPSMRFTGAFSENGTNLSGVWEQSNDGKNWIPWMEVILKRIEI